MGELLLCKEPIAAMPYYIEGISWNVYSLEELCYYVENNTYLLEKDFMTEELCTWIGKEVNNFILAEKLRDIMRSSGKLSEFVHELLEACGYCPKDTIQEIVTILQDMEEKSDFECNKMRADRLLEREKYLSSIYEYKSLLDANDAGEQSKELLGSIWHNLGTAYARMFLFAEAIHCYEMAYKLNNNIESLKQCIMACHCHYDEAGFAEAMEKYQPDAELVQEIKAEMDKAYTSQALENFNDKFGSTVALKALGRRSDYQKEIGNMIFQWKEEYRRICKV
ncbi:MAG: hypothetical protein IJO60_04520 [Agathobacter sp.]|nr:hypothetical protein [Agathobacter sp.]